MPRVVMRLRRGPGPELAARILVHAPGFLIQVAEAELDTLRFEALCRRTDLASRAGRWDDAAALAWFNAEHLNLLAAQQAAAAHRWHRTVWQLAWTLSTFHVRQGHRHDELAARQTASAAAESLSDPITRMRAYRLLGRAHSELGRHREALAHLNQALGLAGRHDEPCERAHTHRTLAMVWERLDEPRRALRHATRARELYRSTRQPIWEAGTLNQAGLYAPASANTTRRGPTARPPSRCTSAIPTPPAPPRPS